jgi:hypothetical protein
MTIAIARQMLAYPLDENCCTCIFDHHDDFVWDDYGDEVDVWNRIAAARGFQAVDVEQGDDDDTYLIQGERRLKVPLRFERGDNAISVHTLGQLLLPAVEFRLCIDTCGNSENAFIALTPAEWQALESEFGTEGVDYRFLHMGKTVDDMWTASTAAMETRAWF